MSDDAMAPPPFHAEAALIQFKRFLRDLRVLVERGSGFTLHGLPVLDIEPQQGVLQVRVAKKPLRTPEWDSFEVAHSAALRQLQDEIKRRLGRWLDE